MKKVLFIDRDGTLIWEPPDTFQIDSFEKLKFIPGVFTWLGRIARELDYELVMVSNQDGLGKPTYPQNVFDSLQRLVMGTLESEGIKFAQVHIDTSFAEEKKPTRKPGTGMLTQYFSEKYDLKNSFVIGDRLTDVELAENLGAKAIFLKNYDNTAGWENKIALTADSWKDIYDFLKMPERKVEQVRKSRIGNRGVELWLPVAERRRGQRIIY